MIDFNEEFNNSYERLQQDSEKFYDTFYDNFMNKSEKVRRMFSNVDMENQKSMLQDSLFYLVSFYATKEAHDYLERLANIHHQDLAICDEMYSWWVDAMIETVQSLDPKFCHLVSVAWRIVLAPGIEFMKHYPLKNKTQIT